MKKVLLVTLQLDCGAAIVRVDPFYHLVQHGYPMEIKAVTDANWQDIAEHDVVYIHRAATDKHLAIALDAKRLGKKLWIDIDDDLFNVPVDNQAFFFYNSNDVKSNMQKICALADIVSVSSKEILKNYGTTYNKNMVYIPCCYDERILGLKAPWDKKRKKIVTWRGSPTHSKSLLEFKDEIIFVAKKHPDWKWNFIGQNPWFICEALQEMDKSSWATWEFLTPMKCLSLLQEIQSAVHMLPLTNNQFTRSRSNSAWFDATLAGSVVLAPTWEHWEQPGIVNYKNRHDFKTKLDRLLTDFDEGKNHQARVDLSWKAINEKWTVKEANKIRITILDKLLGRDSSCDTRSLKMA